MGERVANEKAAQSRLTALEERVAGIDPPQTPPATAPSPKPDKTARKLPDDVTTADILAKTKEETPTPPTVKVVPPPPSAPIQTGSIKSKDEIVFGEAVVTPATRRTLRCSWRPDRRCWCCARAGASWSSGTAARSPH